MLTTLANVKARLKIADSDVTDDLMLTNFVLMVSARFENECNRTFGYGLNETAEFEGDETELRVSRYPIDESQTISFDWMRNTADGWQSITPAPDYIVRRKFVISLSTEQARWQEKLRVTYSGGYALPDGSSPSQALVPLPDDINLACVEQVAFWFQNKDRLGVTNISGQGGHITVPKLDLLPSVVATVARHERWMP